MTVGKEQLAKTQELPTAHCQLPTKGLQHVMFG
jgi:hypothetical protein